jgi:hypothetical protein
MQFHKELIRKAIKSYPKYKEVMTVDEINELIQKVKKHKRYAHLCILDKRMRPFMDALDISVMEHKITEWTAVSTPIGYSPGGTEIGNQLRIAFLQVWKDMLRNRKGLIGKRIQYKSESTLGYFCGTIKAKVEKDIYLVVWDDKAKDQFIFADSALDISVIKKYHNFI